VRLEPKMQKYFRLSKIGFFRDRENCIVFSAN